jgi:hypothetical protein
MKTSSRPSGALRNVRLNWTRAILFSVKIGFSVKPMNHLSSSRLSVEGGIQPQSVAFYRINLNGWLPQSVFA